MSSIVIALGGNALGKTAKEQRHAAAITAETIAEIIASGRHVVITHGNGPQVGMINSALSVQRGEIEDMPLAECVAMSQGYIGYHLQWAIERALARRGMKQMVCTLITQTVVDPDDTAFLDPTKPVGIFYTQAEAEEMRTKTGEAYMEDVGRGWRRVVASPKPTDIVESDIIRHMLDQKIVTICCGGGGIPVARINGEYRGMCAVVDKDYVSALLAEKVGADHLLILTGVDNVYLNYNSDHPQMLKMLTLDEACELCSIDAFAKGSMLPKVQAAIQFAKSGGTTLITSPKNALSALSGNGGTWIVPNGR